MRDAAALTVALPWADHNLRVKKKAPVTQDEVGLALVSLAHHVAFGRHSRKGLMTSAGTLAVGRYE